MGHLRRFWHVRAMSALPPIATGERTSREVEFVPLGDIARPFQARERIEAQLPHGAISRNGALIDPDAPIGDPQRVDANLCHYSLDAASDRGAGANSGPQNTDMR
jgi:hypothetical protein